MFEGQLRLWFSRPPLLKAIHMLYLPEVSATPVPMDCQRVWIDLWIQNLKDCILEGFVRIDDDVVSNLTQLCRDLESLDLSESEHLTGAGLAHLQPLQQLTSLDLCGCYNLTDAGLGHLQPLQQLTSLNLDGCNNLTDAGLGHLQPLQQLTSLDLCGCNNLTDAGLAHLKGLRRLTDLKM